MRTGAIKSVRLILFLGFNEDVDEAEGYAYHCEYPRKVEEKRVEVAEVQFMYGVAGNRI